MYAKIETRRTAGNTLSQAPAHSSMCFHRESLFRTERKQMLYLRPSGCKNSLIFNLTKASNTTMSNIPTGRFRWKVMALAKILLLLLALLLACHSSGVEAQQQRRQRRSRRGLKGSPQSTSSLDASSNDDGDSFVVTAFTDSESLDVCGSNILASLSKGNGSKRFGPTEFSTFLDRQSNGVIQGSFDDLQAIFVLVFYTAACICCFAETGDNQCCVEQAHIPLEGEVDASTFYQILEFLCPNIDQLISDLTIKEPTRSPVGSPTVNPSALPSPFPTGAPSLFPSSMPTLTASASPLKEDSIAPSALSNIPSNLPSQMPSSQISLPPSKSPSDHPTLKPSKDETDLLCLSFTYSLETLAAISADDIVFEVNNTIKQGLLTATRNITISILNETTPLAEARSSNIFDKKSLEGGRRSLKNAMMNHFENERSVARNSSDQEIEHWTREFHRTIAPQTAARTNSLQTRRRRHLAFYSDDIPVRIWNVVDSMFCRGADSGGTCVSVLTEVCVVLVSGETASAVRLALIQGFRSSIESGAFRDAIPPSSIP